MSGECKTADEALGAALACIVETNEGMRLHQANFGRYADGSGWWWQVTFTRSYGNAKNLAQGDDFSSMVRETVASWHRQVDHYKSLSEG